MKKSNNYKTQYGFKTKIKTEKLFKGLNKENIILLSKKRQEPQFLLDFRLRAFEELQKMTIPTWCNFNYDKIDLNHFYLFSEIKTKKINKKEEKELNKTFKKLGINMTERNNLKKRNVAYDLIFDSISIKTFYKKKLQKYGIIFLSFKEAVLKFPHLIQQYLGTVIPIKDNFFSTLNSAVFSDGSFCYIPKNVKCPLNLSTYFRINNKDIGQFERTLIIAEENSLVNYSEGCTAPVFNNAILHCANVEIICKKNAVVNYTTVQNWYSGSSTGKGGIYNFVTKRGRILGDKGKISWIQVELGSSRTWKYPSIILEGDSSVGEFLSISYSKNKMAVDTGTKMIHIGKNTRSLILSKNISNHSSKSSYRGLVKILPQATNSYNFSQCDSIILSDKSTNTTIPTFLVLNNTSSIQHEALATYLDLQKYLYLLLSGIEKEKIIGLLVLGNLSTILERLPIEYKYEVFSLLEYEFEKTLLKKLSLLIKKTTIKK